MVAQCKTSNMNSPLESFTKTKDAAAQSVEQLYCVAVYDENVILTYRRHLAMPDGSTVSLGASSVTRLIEEIPQELIDAVKKIASFSEQWKAEDAETEAANAAARAANKVGP